ncbi:hypothetical protein A8D95_28245 [Burkholderia cenocepacia]|jgi:hypothetical protein|uniref:Uncharacterized protein n=2 Tax=Burkholderia cenocepacia TaxID=95486 RepID=A0A1V2VUN2_9BURK|nr:hypothetical protein [Burkholderia cenocepacia]ELW9531672.1 hypothetical protein [Burkholderia cenocepacia]MBR7937266.1 hypothetical protein [Burkholderia cenocepacia]MBR7971324.1 hypothetical protein [Burkholderia cenocepacia]MBR8250873.1 hypothetical protein [Burkholderia cenocepacia]MBR8408502.1 hypothetical protein [Burkholderia cenocepacia]
MYHSVPAPNSGGDAVSRHAPFGVAIRLFARSCFLLANGCALSSEQIDAGTDVDLSQNDACPMRPDAKPHVAFAALLRTSPAGDARRCWPGAYCAAAIGGAARRTGPEAVSYLRKRLS